MEYFYNLTFADSREEGISEALGVGPEMTALPRLTALADSLLLSPKLKEQETPSFLRHDNVVRQMHLLADNLIKEGLSMEVADTLVDHALLAVSYTHLTLPTTPYV